MHLSAHHHSRIPERKSSLIDHRLVWLEEKIRVYDPLIHVSLATILVGGQMVRLKPVEWK